MTIEYGQPGWNDSMIPDSSSFQTDLTGFGKGLTVGGGLLKAYGLFQEGNAAYADKQNQALQYESQIPTVKAISQRAFAETNRQTGLVQSRIISLAAASGASASDPGVVNLVARQKGYGAYQAALDLYKGEDEARSLQMRANAARYEGDQAQKASRIGAVSSLLQTGAMLAFAA
jgi:hypothetical protein